MSYGIVLTLLLMVVGIFAAYALFKREMPKPEQLRVKWEPPASLPPPEGLPFPLRFSGPDRYCPICGRRLVQVNEDGTFVLAGNAGLRAEGELVIENGVPQTEQVETLVVDAVCLECNPDETLK